MSAHFTPNITFKKTESHSSPAVFRAADGEKSVFFHGKPLYSEFSPKKNVVFAASSLKFPKNSLILAFSPVLCYGLAELKARAGENGSKILLIERDKDLADFSAQFFEKFLDSDCKFLFPKSAAEFEKFFQNDEDFCLANFRFVQKIDLSAGADENRRAFDAFFAAAQSMVWTFWRNRLIFIRLGRLYSKNFWKNLRFLPFSSQILPKTVANPILALGSGPSADALFESGVDFSKIFVIAAENSVLPLLSRKIRPDLCVSLESQAAIEDAFCGMDESLPFVFDLTSRSQIVRRFKNRSFVFSRFGEFGFLQKFSRQSFAPLEIPPLGSVGIAALYLASILRQSEKIPIFACGLDFCFQNGKTHCSGTSQIERKFREVSRLSGSDFSQFSESDFAAVNKKGGRVLTNPAFKGYCAIEDEFFAGEKNIFDASPFGLPNSLEKVEFSQISQIANFFAPKAKGGFFCENHFCDEKAILQFCDAERSQLEALKSAKSRDEIEKIAKCREYLFLHFPDGEKFRNDENFCARILREAEFFLGKVL